jgi:hypothetical protein
VQIEDRFYWKKAIKRWTSPELAIASRNCGDFKESFLPKTISTSVDISSALTLKPLFYGHAQPSVIHNVIKALDKLSK